jgi:hypothetical protein
VIIRSATFLRRVHAVGRIGVVLGWLASSIHILWLSIVIYVLAAVPAAVGFVMTFRDYSF